MDSGRKRKRVNVEGDRLSSLPNDLIFKILSFIGFKYTIQTSVLSSRWRFIWTLMPYLNFSSEDFSSLPKFSKIVTHVLSRRNNQMQVLSVKLSLHGRVSQAFVKRILNYAFSHNVQQMTITCLLEKKIKFPHSFFSSQSLKHLTLIGCTIDPSITRGSTWELPALTTLYLDHVTLYNEDDDVDNDNGNSVVIFSKCTNLKNLTLNSCSIKGLDSDSDGFNICHPQLSNLTLENGYWGCDFVHVDAPQLKNLTVVNCDWVHLSAPDLTSIIYRSGYSLKFSTDSLPKLETVDLCIRKPYSNNAHDIVGLLQHFNSVKFLTLNLETIEVLSSSLELVSHQHSPFSKLKWLKIYPAEVLSDGQSQKKVNVSNEVKKYLLDSSPSATLAMVTREEIRAVRNTSLAQNLMAELRVLLEQEKAKIDRHEQGKAQVGMKVQPPQLEKAKTCHIILKLQDIEGVLTKLPIPNRGKVEACFSNLVTEASLVMKKINRAMIHCDTMGSR